jgi:GntR family transcriptional repressor for pyruvate dehydrogenase complex
MNGASDSMVVRQRLSEQVAQHLRELIVEGDIAAGEALPTERELARRFAVSSVVIREALNSLSVTGLVEIRHGVGSFVTSPDRWQVAEPIATLIRSGRADLLQVVEVRAIIELEISGLAAERHDETTILALDSALARMNHSLHDPVANVEADMAFHSALASGAGNPVLWLLLQPIIAPIHTGMLRGTLLPAAMARALEEHRRIRDAVAARDADGARQAMRTHMRTSRVELAAHLNPAQAATASPRPLAAVPERPGRGNGRIASHVISGNGKD